MNSYSFLLILISFCTTFFGLYGLRHPKAKGSLAFSLLLFSVTFYTFGYSLELEATTFVAKWRWILFEYLGLSALPCMYLLFTARFTSLDRFITPRVRLLLLAFPVVSLLIVYSNPFHQLFYQNPDVVKSGRVTLLFFERGPLYWVNLAYVYGFLFWSLLLQVYFLRTAASVYRNQIRIILAGALIPWFVSLLQQAGLGFPGFDMAPVGFAFSCIAVAIVFFRYRMFDVVPIALESVFDSLSDGILLIDNEKRVINFNPRFKAIFPGIDATAYGAKCNELSCIEPDLAGLSEGKYPQGELLFARGEGMDAQHFVARIFPVIRRGFFIGQYLVVHDITDYIKYTQMLKANEKSLAEMNATKDLFFSIIAHDLRGPMANLTAMFTLLEEHADEFSEEEREKYLKVMRETADNTHRFLENLLTWSASQRGKITFRPQWASLSALLSENIEMIQSAADAKKVKLVADFSSSLQAEFDIQMMSTIVRNLLSNALKFSFPDGTIRVTATAGPEEASVKVFDTGTGMSPETLSRLFTLSSERRSVTGTMGETGTGLGLMLCKEFLEKHGSSLEMESRLGEGSSFGFTFTFAAKK